MKKLVYLSLFLILAFLTGCDETEEPIPEFGLNGPSRLELEVHEDYNELGINYEGEEYEVVIEGQVDTSIIGEYEISYYLKSSSKESRMVTRTVKVVDTTKPLLTLLGDEEITLEAGSFFVDPGVEVVDNYDENLDYHTVGSVDSLVLGEHEIGYYAVDASDNESEYVYRTIRVVDTTAPELSFVGEETMYHEVGHDFVDPGVSISDNYDTDITAEVDSSLDVNVVGEYTIIYNAMDSQGNAGDSIQRTVIVQDTTKPEITLIGRSNMMVPIGFDYQDLGVEVSDNYTSNEDLVVTTNSNIDVENPGVYEISYQVTDAFGNTSDLIIREVIVKDYSGDFQWNLREDDTYEVLNYLGDDAMVYIPKTHNGKSVSVVQAYAFQDAEVEFVWIPQTIVSIETCAFLSARNLEEVHFEEDSSLQVIKRWGFNRTSIQSIVLPNSLQVLHEGVFSGSEIQEIVLPSTLHTIYGNPFSDMMNLSSLKVDEDNVHFMDMDDVLFTKDMKRLIAYGRGSAFSTYSVPMGVEIIGANAIDSLYYLEELILPEGLIEIENRGIFACGLSTIVIPSTLEVLGHNVFVMMYELNAFEVPDANPYLQAVDGVLFSRDLKILYAYPADRNVQEYRIPYGVEEVKSGAFWDADIEELYLSRSITTLKGGAFLGIPNLERAYVPYSLTHVENSIFDGANDLTIFMEFLEEPAFFDDYWNQDNAEVVWGYNVSAYLDYTYELIVDDITGEPAYEIIGYIGQDTVITLPSEYNGLPVTSIGYKAFEESDLTSITFSSSINKIRPRAFSDSSNLTEVVFPVDSQLRKIFHSAFAYTSIEDLLLPESLEYVGERAFDLIRDTSIFIPKNVEEIGYKAFDNPWLEELVVAEENNYFTSVDGVLYSKDMTQLIFYPEMKKDPIFDIPVGVTTIARGTITFNQYITSMTIPNTVVDIEEEALTGLLNLEALFIPESIEYIGFKNFNDLLKLDAFVVDENNAFYTSVDGVLFTKDMTVLLSYPGGKSGTEYTIPEGVIEVAPFALRGDNDLVTIIVSRSVETIGQFAFGGDIVLNVYIPNTVVHVAEHICQFNPDLRIYLEATEIPATWDPNFAGDNEVVLGSEMPND